MIWFVASIPWLYVALVIYRIFAEDKRHTQAMRTQTAARQAYFAQRDPHCDGCAAHEKKEPLPPVTRCSKCMSCMAGLIGDPLFGFDFEKYREPPTEKN